MSSIIQLRRGLAAEWVTANPVLRAGEPGVEIDTGKEKIGDGVTHWNALPYKGGSGGSVANVAYFNNGAPGFSAPANGDLVTVPIWALIFAENGCFLYDPAHPTRLVCNLAGYWLPGGVAGFEATAHAGNRRYIQLNQSIAGDDMDDSTAGSLLNDTSTVNLSTSPIELQLGEYVEIQVGAIDTAPVAVTFLAVSFTFVGT